MFRNDNTIHIDLHLPTSWNACTTEELEAIAAAIISEQQRVDRYHPFDWSRVKLNVVLAVNHIEVVSDAAPRGGNSLGFMGDEEYLVRRSKDEEPWGITVGHLLALTEKLAWIDDEKSDKTVFRFPYPTLEVSGSRDKGTGTWFKSGDKGTGTWFKSERTYQSPLSPLSPLSLVGPPPLLDGYTWKEYRWLTDWMQEYMRIANALAQGKREDGRGKAALDSARNEFLAVLFKPKEGTSAISHLTSDIFEDFSPVKWQVILFWWSSLMAQLAKKFPKVFKQQPVGKGKRKQQQKDTPWDFYNRVTATIQKYVGGLSAQDVDDQPYGVTLQQLEMMATEAAEMEKLKKKK